MWTIVVTLLAVGIGTSSAQLPDDANYGGCFPKFEPFGRPTCQSEAVEGWHFWNTMNYKFFPKKLSWQGAFDLCNPWDEAVCRGEYPNGVDQRLYYSHPISILSKDEANAAQDAYRDSCIKGGPWFWTGAVSNDGGYIKFSDYTRVEARSIGITFDPWLTKGSDCIAMNGVDGSFKKFPCSDQLGVVCKIVWNKH